MKFDPIALDRIEATPVQPAKPDAPAPDITAAECARAGTLAGTHPEAPHAFLEAVVAALWHATTRARPLRAPFRSGTGPVLDAPARAFAHRLGTRLAGHDPAGIAAALGTLHTELLPTATRTAQGSFFTPPALAELLLARATEAGTDWRSCRVLDPACGAGAILLPALQRIRAAVPDRDPALLLDAACQRLRGCDIDPVAAWIAQVAVDLALLPAAAATGRPLPQIVQLRDMLEPGDDGRHDLVVGNPPYGQVRLDGARRARFARSVHGRANLYGLFLDRALELVPPGGVIAYLTPPGCLGGQFFKALRGLLARDAPPASLDFVTARRGVFAGAQQETMLSTWRRGGAPGPIRLAECHLDHTGYQCRIIGQGHLPAMPEAPWFLPRRRDQAALARSGDRIPDRLADWGYSVQTGKIEAPRDSDRIAEHPAPGHVPLFRGESIEREAGLVWPRIRRKSGIWFDARDRETRLVRSSGVLVQRTTAPEQPRRLVAAALTDAFLANHPAVAVENHLNVLVPRAPIVAPEVLAALLNSAAADAAFRCLSGSLAVSAYELDALPLPPAGRLGDLAHLVAAAAPRAHIEAECARLYGLAGADNT